jgi:hypothetical protein
MDRIKPVAIWHQFGKNIRDNSGFMNNLPDNQLFSKVLSVDYVCVWCRKYALRSGYSLNYLPNSNSSS